ncbi:MAG: class II fumarate hydratase [Acidobacteriota bacterium]
MMDRNPATEADRMAAMRTESDSMGSVEVPSGRYWGAQTQRSLEHFSIGQERMPLEVIHALALVKLASARANRGLGRLDAERAALIERAAKEVADGMFDEHFPLRIYQTGSGTQTNMNVNEVIANRCSELAGEPLGSKRPVHPNDHVNMSHSTNDAFPAAMYMAAALGLERVLLPAVERLRASLAAKAAQWGDIVKIGRTHLQDAVPMTLGQEFSGYSAMLAEASERLRSVLPGLGRLALGGSAVGTGLNTPPGYARLAVAEIAALTGHPFSVAPNLFAAMGAHDALVMASGAIRTLAVSLCKIAGDVRLLGSGPRAGLFEIILPANEPGSSIMPGKVNPTQCEAVTMAALQCMGYDAAVAAAGAGGILEINLYKPLMIHNVMQSITVLADCCLNFARYCVDGLEPNKARIDAFLKDSLMLVTALSPVIGYDKAAKVAHHAHTHGATLRDAALELGFVSGEEFDRLVDAYAMARPHAGEEG